MPTANYLPDVLETTEAERLATGVYFYKRSNMASGRLLVFRRSSAKHADSLDARQRAGTRQDHDWRQRHYLRPAGPHDRLRGRRPSPDDGKVESLVDNYKGGRFNRPNDVICHSNGCLYFTDPDQRRPYREREIPGPEGDITCPPFSTWLLLAIASSGNY